MGDLMEYPPTYCRGRLFVNLERGRTVALEASTGKVLWSRPAPGPTASSPAISGQNVVVSSHGGTVTALRQSSGALVWQLRTNSPVESSPVAVGASVYVGASDGRLFALDAATGSTRWVYDFRGRISSSPSVVGGLVCITTYTGAVACLHRADGTRAWISYFKRDAFRYESFYSSPSSDGRLLFAVARTGKLVAIEALTGDTRLDLPHRGTHVRDAVRRERSRLRRELLRQRRRATQHRRHPSVARARAGTRAGPDARRRQPRLLLDARGPDVRGARRGRTDRLALPGREVRSGHRDEEALLPLPERASRSVRRRANDLPVSGTRLVSREHAWIVLGALAAVVLLNVGTLGSDPWSFRPGNVEPRGALAFLVRLADERWDVGLLRSVAMLAGCGVAVLALVALTVRAWRSWILTAAAFAVAAALILPAVTLQIGLRQSTRPVVLRQRLDVPDRARRGSVSATGRAPTATTTPAPGSSVSTASTEALLPGRPSARSRSTTSPTFPAPRCSRAHGGFCPRPWDDYRVLVALTTLGLLGAALAFPGPLWARLAFGIAAAANPVAVRAAWFGTADAPTLLLLLTAFALALRRRPGWTGVALGAAILTKQFALAAAPFLLVLLLVRGARRDALRAGAAAAAVIAAGFLPFLIADAGDVWTDTVRYGAGTYRIVGYGLSALLLRAHILGDRNGAYPFFALVLAVWLPVTVLLARGQLLGRRLWLGAAGFTGSVFTLLFIGRVFQISYLVYPLTGLALTGLLAAAERDSRRRLTAQPVPSGARERRRRRARTPPRSSDPRRTRCRRGCAPRWRRARDRRRARRVR